MLNDPEITLLRPQEDEPAPEISIVIPALNEESTIEEFVDWCKQGIAAAGVKGEILIVDSSSDQTATLALKKGARVLKTPKRGLGRAYIDSIPYIRGKLALLGDADLTYDFRQLSPFVEKYREGYEYIMGSRFLGKIDKGAMPKLHQYFGTPLTTWILNVIYATKFSDIHCGMRGITLDGLKRINLQSQSWEYASEMVIKSQQCKLRTAEVPIHFLKDPPGRDSHLKRAGLLAPWKAGWINLRAMFVHGADFFLTRPGLILFIIGVIFSMPFNFRPVTIGPITFSIFWRVLGLACVGVGLQSFYMGLLSKTMHDYDGSVLNKLKNIFNYNRSMSVCFGLFILGVIYGYTFISEYIQSGFLIKTLSSSSYKAIFGLELILIAFLTFTFTLMLNQITFFKNEMTR